MSSVQLNHAFTLPETKASQTKVQAEKPEVKKQAQSIQDEVVLKPSKHGIPVRLLIGTGSGAVAGGATLGTFMAGRLVKEGLQDAIVATGEKLVKGPIILESSIVGGGIGAVTGGIIGGVTGGVIGMTAGYFIDDPKTAAVVGTAVGLVAVGALSLTLKGNVINSLGLGAVAGVSGGVSSYLVSSFK